METENEVFGEGMNEDQLERSFLALFDAFQELNLLLQIETKKNPPNLQLQKTLTNMLMVFQDLSEHYFWEEIKRRDKKNSYH